MRKSRQETAETRERIVRAASVEFRNNGINGTGLADLMAAAGLTHGGFYKHFESKEQLVAESMALASTGLVDTLVGEMDKPGGEDAIKRMIARYLSPDHAQDRGTGCPFVALASELARGSEAVRGVATTGFIRLVDIMASQLKNTSPAASRKDAIVMLCTMIGAATMARVVTDPALSKTILNEAKKRLAV